MSWNWHTLRIPPFLVWLTAVSGPVSLFVWPLSLTRLALCTGLGVAVAAVHLVWPDEQYVGGGAQLVALAMLAASQTVGTLPWPLGQAVVLFLSAQSIISLGVRAVRPPVPSSTRT